jgi:sarcosine oxidase, subunit alpha
MSALDFEGRPVALRPGDTIASALFRAGVRVFSRSFKYRRPRGLYCLTGDCPNCLVTVDGAPAVRACQTPAAAGQRVDRRPAWPSPDRDAMALIRLVKRFLPVGFYYKMFLRPRWLWPLAERMIRRVAGVGPVPRDRAPEPRERRAHHPDVLVIGGGTAGLSAALGEARAGRTVLLADEGCPGERLAPGPEREALEDLVARLGAGPRATILERATAVGVYEGPMVPLAAPDALHLVFPGRVIVATGAVETHPVFPGGDLPGVWLARGAARMAGAHGVPLGRCVVFAGVTEEGLAHLATLAAAPPGVAVALLPAALARRAPAGVRVIADGTLRRARGRGRVRSVEVESPAGRETIRCDALVLAFGLEPRNGLLRQSAPHESEGAGQCVDAGAAPAPPCGSGVVCLCEDVETADLEQAWDEGYRSTELLKRYTTVTMGPCQGALCHPHLRRFVEARGGPGPRAAATTARPPARTVTLGDLAAGARYPLEHRTALHERHLALGATMEWAGAWKRPERYGDVLEEYRAVRQGVSVMDVGTLGKYRVAGPDATAFLERLYPNHVATVGEGRSRYALLLNEAGYLIDDGLICREGPGDWYLTFTSGGADHAEAWLRDWAETWGHRVHVANLTATLGAINVTGPASRDLLARLGGPADGGAVPYSQHRRLVVAGVPCHVLRVGFTGELSYELHHPRDEGPRLWDALLEAGAPLGVRPHGLEALRLLRLEKAHIIVGQDTDFDSTPAKLRLDWAVKFDKPAFVGRTALLRIAALPHERALRQVRFGAAAPVEGAQLLDPAGTHLGYLTSSRFSPVLGHGVALGWVRRPDAGWPARVVALDPDGRRHEGVVVTGPFYDPKGERLRA